MTRLYIRSTRDHTPKSRHPQSIGTLRSRPPRRLVALPRSRERQRCRPPRHHGAGSGGRRRGAAAITHDLDVVDGWPVFTALRLAELARKGELRRVARTLGSALSAIGRSPIQSALRVLLADERARGIVSTWFVLCGTPTLK